MFRQFCAILAISVLVAAPAIAQEVEHGRWSFGGTEFRGDIAWVTAQREDAGVWRLTVACAGTGLSIDLASDEAPAPDATAVLTFNIGGKTFAAPAGAAEPAQGLVWLAELPDDLASALTAGFSARVFAPEGSALFGLTGSSRSIGAVREACAAARDAAAGALPPVDAEQAEAALMARIAAACAPAEAVVGEGAIQSRDLTSDGRADHVIDWSRVSCAGAGAEPVVGAGQCDADMCAAEIYVSPALPPDPATDTIRHSGLELWPDRHVAIRSRSTTFLKPLDWRWDGTEFLASIPYRP